MANCTDGFSFVVNLLLQVAAKQGTDAVRDNSFLSKASAPLRKSHAFDEAQQAGDAVQRICSPLKALAPLRKSSVFDGAQQESMNNKVDHSEHSCCPRLAQISA